MVILVFINSKCAISFLYDKELYFILTDLTDGTLVNG